MTRKSKAFSLLVTWALCFSALAAIAAMTWVTETITPALPGDHGAHTLTTVVLQADADGAVSATIPMVGYLERMVATPQIVTSYIVGTTYLSTFAAGWPAAAWDCELRDRDGTDLTGGALKDRLSTTSQIIYPWTVGSAVNWKPYLAGEVPLVCSAIGTYKKAQIRFYLSE